MSAPMMSPTKLRSLQYLYLTKPNGRVVAHCLTLDIVTAADDIEKAELRLDFLVKRRVEWALLTGSYSALNTPAPEKFFRVFNEAVRNGRLHKSNRPMLMVKVPDVVPLDQDMASLTVLAATAA